MVFSLKMASKSKPFSMKKPSQKRDVFRASQKSFFWRSWTAPGQCPMAVFIFFFVFGIFGRKWVPKMMHCAPPLAPKRRPKTLQKRIRGATSIFQRSWKPFGWYFDGFGFQNRAIGTPRPYQNVPKTHPQPIILRRCRGSLPISRFPSPYFKWPVSLGCGGVALRL